jgi:hypothetical protein
MQKRVKIFSFVMAAMLIGVSVLNLTNSASATVPGTNQIVSRNTSGNQANNWSGSSFISANGNMVVFYSRATNIVSSGGSGVFVKNLTTGSVTRVNVSTAGVISDESSTPVYTVPEAISATGRYILLNSYAPNLIDGTTMSTSNPQLYLRDTVASTTTLVSQTAAGVVSNGSVIGSLGVSSDGRFVTFLSNASNLHPDSTNGKAHLYMVDRSNNSISILDRKTDGTLGSTVASPSGSMSCDGSFVTFQYGSNLIVGDTDSNHVDVYLLDLRSGGNKLTNLTKTANSAAFAPTISCNGDFVGFDSLATNIDPNLSVTSVVNAYRPYVYDRVNSNYYFAAVTSSNTSTNAAVCGTSGSTKCIQVSDKGVGVFQANDSTLMGVSGSQIYMRDIYAGTTDLISKNSAGTSANAGVSPFPTISADGKIVSYWASASNLVSGDTNSQEDIFTSLTGY